MAPTVNATVIGGLVAAILLIGLGPPLGKRFGRFVTTRSLPLHVLKSKSGVSVHVSPIGCAIQKLLVPDSRGRLKDVVLGFDDLTAYLDGRNPYFGVVVGRCANRIANGQFTLDGQTYHLPTNDPPNELHGGVKGFDKKVWSGTKFTNGDGEGLKLQYTSKDGEEGFPGTVEATVTYLLTAEGVLKARFEAVTDKATPINMAQHTYWNLGGHDSGSVLQHQLMINGDHYTPKNNVSIPTGEIASVKGTPFDFTFSKAIGKDIKEVPGGYDHNFVLHGMGRQAKFTTRKGIASEMPKLSVEVLEPRGGRKLTISSTAPGLQFYSGNFLDGSIVGKDGVAYELHGGFALETQGFPDAVNQPTFPSVIIRPGERYSQDVHYAFSVSSDVR